MRRPVAVPAARWRVPRVTRRWPPKILLTGACLILLTDACLLALGAGFAMLPAAGPGAGSALLRVLAAVAVVALVLAA